MSRVDLNRARDEMDQLCHACAFDAGTCRCVIECGAINCLGAAERTATIPDRHQLPVAAPGPGSRPEPGT